MTMAKLRGLPWHTYYCHGQRFAADGEGLIEAPAEFVAALVVSGCVLAEPYSHAPPPKVEPVKPPEPLPTIWMKGAKGAGYAPRSGSNLRYHASGDGYLKVHAQDVRAMQAMGCQLVGEPEPTSVGSKPAT
jgi:hypothetical protein